MPTVATLDVIAAKEWSFSLDATYAINRASWSPNGQYVALACYPDFVVILDGATGKEITRLEKLDYFQSHTLWADGGLRLAVQVSSSLKVFDCADWSVSSDIAFDAAWNTTPDVDKSGAWIACGFRVVGSAPPATYTGFGNITIRSIHNWPESFDFNTKQECGGVAWSPGDQLAHWDRFAYVTIWDVAKQSVLKAFSLPEDRVACLTWHPSGETIVVGSRFDTNLYVYDVGSTQLLHKLDLHPNGDLSASGINRAEFSHDGKWFLSKDTTLDSRVILWDTETWHPVAQYESAGGGKRKRVPLAAIRPDGTLLLVPNDDCTGVVAWSFG